MAKSPPKNPKKRKDPAERGAAEQKRIKPTRAKASRPDAAATPDTLADLLNPAIKTGTAGIGSGTGQYTRVTSPQRGEVDRAKRGRVRGIEPLEFRLPSPVRTFGARDLSPAGRGDRRRA
jgi:outer membrane biosynthesis protein TonB